MKNFKAQFSSNLQCGSLHLPASKRINDSQPLPQRHPALHVLRKKSVAAGEQRTGGDHRVVDQEAVALREHKAGLMRLDADGMNGEKFAQRRQKLMRLFPGEAHLATCDIGEFVQHLHADRAALSDKPLRNIRFLRVARSEIDQKPA